MDQEIDLREYIGIAVKRKKIVFGVLFASVFSTAVWSFFSPRIYDVSMVIEPPISAITDSGVQGWDSVTNIKAKIEAGVYNSELIDEANPLLEISKFAVAIPKDTRLIKVSLKIPAGQVDLGKKILAKLTKTISTGYEAVIEDKRNKIDNQIKIVQGQIGIKENEIKLRNEQFKILEARERQFIEDIKDIRGNSERLLAKREAIFERKENKDDVAALFYAATLQQNTNYSLQLQNDLADLRNKKEGVINAAENLKNSINESRIEIEGLNLLKAGIRNIQVIQEPRRSSWPVGPKRKQNTLLAGFAGLIVGLFGAFVAEYLESPRRNS